LRWTSGALGKSLTQLEREADDVPPGRPFVVQEFAFKVGLSFIAALLLMATVDQAAKSTWLGLFFFGGVFLGMAISPWLGNLVRPKSGEAQPPAWNDHSWSWRFGMGAAMGGMVILGAWALSLFATSTDIVFVEVVYLALFAGLFLKYGERSGGPRPMPRPTLPEPIRVDGMSRIAAAALVVLAILPAIGLVNSNAHDKWFTHDRHDNRIAYEYAYNILAGLDEDAIIFTNGDNDTFPIWYLQEVEHFRRDVTVVNLSLVNLPWYIKQLRRLETPVDLNYTTEEIEALRPIAYRDKDTGEVVYVMVREYVVRDIVDANRQKSVADQRPVFFAVTIPRENMDAYYSFLQMEGLAYRLTETRSPDGMPSTDPERLLANVFGAYQFDALTTGSTSDRHAAFAEQAGWVSDQPKESLLTGLSEPLPVDYESLLVAVGQERKDVHQSSSTRNLLGNYPACIARAGFSYLAEAEKLRLPDGSISGADTTSYDHFTDQAMICYEMALRFDPVNGLVAAGYYPTLLLERQRIDEALAYLVSIHNKVSPELERSAVLNSIRGLMAMQQTPVAVAWLEQRIGVEPDWRLGYELLFRIHEATGEVGRAAEITDRWRDVNGQDDAALRRQLELLRQRSQDAEQERIEEQIRQHGAEPEEQR